MSTIKLPFAAAVARGGGVGSVYVPAADETCPAKLVTDCRIRSIIKFISPFRSPSTDGKIHLVL